MAVASFKFPPPFRRPKNVKIPKRSGVRAVVVDSSNNFLLTLQDILNPDLSLMYGKMQVHVINNIPDFRVSYYCGRTIIVFFLLLICFCFVMRETLCCLCQTVIKLILLKLLTQPPDI